MSQRGDRSELDWNTQRNSGGSSGEHAVDVVSKAWVQIVFEILLIISACFSLPTVIAGRGSMLYNCFIATVQASSIKPS
jgi:hypothetical protein